MSGNTFVRPTGAQMIADVINHSPEHPRLLARGDDFDRMRVLRGRDAQYAAWVEEFLKRADRYVNEAVMPVYHVDEGGRLQENVPFSGVLSSMGFAYRMTGNRAYVAYAVRFMRVLADHSQFPDWLPAHYLNCAGVMKGVALAYDWLYDALGVEERALFEDALATYAMDSAIGAYQGTHEGMNSHGFFGRSGWTRTENNWNAVCNSALTLTCLAVCDVPSCASRAEWLFDHIMPSIEIGIRCYDPDGSYEESPGYWSYGTNNLFTMMEALLSATGTTYGLMEAPGLSETCYYALYVEGPCGMWNYHDSGAGREDTSHFFWVSRYLGDENLARLQMQRLEDGVVKPSLTDLLYYPQDLEGSATLPLDYASVGIQTAILRSGWGKEDLFTGLHGGYNSVNHGDIDAGNFILDLYGVRWFCDLGGDDYVLPGFFGKGKNGSSWRYYRKGAEGQNTLIFTDDPELPHGQDPEARVPLFYTAFREGEAVAALDMRPAFGPHVRQAVRAMKLTHNRSVVLIRDTFRLSHPAAFRWSAHTEQEITLSERGKCATLTAHTPDGEKHLTVRLMTAMPVFFEVLPADGTLKTTVPHERERDRSRYRKLVVRCACVEKGSLTVALIGEGCDADREVLRACDRWEEVPEQA